MRVNMLDVGRTRVVRGWVALGMTLALALVVGYGQAEVLPVEVKEVVTISPEGDAAITRLLVIPPSPLTELYSAY